MPDCARFSYIGNLRIELLEDNAVSVTTVACYVEFACFSKEAAEELYKKLCTGVYVLSAYERTPN